MFKISRVVRMMAHPKAVQEFSLGLQVIRPIMIDPQETRDNKQKALHMMVDELSEGTFRLEPIAEQIMRIINMKEDVCREYPDSEIQTDGILEWLPRMREYRDKLTKEVGRCRKEYGLRS